MSYAAVIWYLTIIAAGGAVLVVLTNIFSQVLKKVINRENYPAQAIVFFVAEVLTIMAAAILAAILKVQMLWYYWALAAIAGVMVAYGAMFGYDNLYTQLFTAVKSLIAAIFGRGESK